MQDYLTGFCVSAQTNALAGPMPLREEVGLPRVFFQSARNLGSSAKAMVSRVRTANPLKAGSGRPAKQGDDAAQLSQCIAEADFREDLRHFLDPNPKGRQANRDN